MEPSTTDAEAGLKARFFHHFQDEAKSLEAAIERLKHMSASGGERNEAVDSCLAGIDRLSHEVKDASGYIPAYDQRTCSQTVKSLSDSLQGARNSFQPPKKFSFKTARKLGAGPSGNASDARQLARGPGMSTSSVGPSGSESPLAPGKDTEQVVPFDDLDAKGAANISHGTGIRRPSFFHSNQVVLCGYTSLHIALPASASHATSSGMLSHLTHCIVDLSAATTANTPFAALYLKDIQDCLIICGQVAGAIHITNMSNSVLVTACRQFRMHGSKDVDVYLHAGSRPIFEDCEGLRFAPLPEPYMSDAMAQVPNQWDQIDDFKWLKADPSPHFHILDEEDRCKNEVWKSRVIGAKDEDLEEILKATRRR